MALLSRRSILKRTLSLGLAVPTGFLLYRNENEIRRLLTEGEKKVQSKAHFIGDSGSSHRADPPIPLPDVKNYAAYLATLSLRHISPHEVINPHRRSRNGVPNRLPPPALWRKLAPTLAVADEIRQQLGVPLRLITSAYRSPAYNAQCPGAANRSFHTRNQALDLIFDTDPEHVAKVAEELRDQGFFRGGIGRYNSFIHIDTRGRNADWGNLG